MLWYYKGTGEACVHIASASKSLTLVETDPTQQIPPVNSVLAFAELLVTAGSLSTPALCPLRIRHSFQFSKPDSPVWTSYLDSLEGLKKWI